MNNNIFILVMFYTCEIFHLPNVARGCSWMLAGIMVLLTIIVIIIVKIKIHNYVDICTTDQAVSLNIFIVLKKYEKYVENVHTVVYLVKLFL